MGFFGNGATLDKIDRDIAAIADGTADLSATIGASGGDAPGRISTNLNRFFSRVRGLISHSRECSVSIAADAATYVVAGWWSDTATDPLASEGRGLDALAGALLRLGWTVDDEAIRAAIEDRQRRDQARATLGLGSPAQQETNLINGQVLNIRVIQDGTGSRTLAYGSKYKWPGGTAPTLSTTAAAVDFMSCQYDSTSDTLLCVMSQAFA